MSFNCDSWHLGNPHHLSLTSHRSGQHFSPSIGYAVFILEVLPVFLCNFLQIWTAFSSLYWISTEMLSSSWKFYLYFSVISYIRGQRFRPSIGNLRKYCLHLYLSVFVCNFLQIWTFFQFLHCIENPQKCCLHWGSYLYLSATSYSRSRQQHFRPSIHQWSTWDGIKVQITTLVLGLVHCPMPNPIPWDFSCPINPQFNM